MRTRIARSYRYHSLPQMQISCRGVRQGCLSSLLGRLRWVKSAILARELLQADLRPVRFQGEPDVVISVKDAQIIWPLVVHLLEVVSRPRDPDIRYVGHEGAVAGILRLPPVVSLLISRANNASKEFTHLGQTSPLPNGIEMYHFVQHRRPKSVHLVGDAISTRDAEKEILTIQIIERRGLIFGEGLVTEVSHRPK